MKLLVRTIFIGTLSLVIALFAAPSVRSQQVPPPPAQVQDEEAKAAADKAAAAAAEKISTELKKEIKAAWEARAKRLLRVRVVYESKVLDIPDLESIREQMALPDWDGKPINEEPVKTKHQSELRFAGRQTFYARSGELTTMTRHPIQYERCDAYDGDLAWETSREGLDRYPFGRVRKSTLDYCESATIVAATSYFRWAYCPLDDKVSHIEIANSATKASRRILDGKDLVVLERPWATYRYSYFLDPKRGYVVTQMIGEQIGGDGCRNLERHSVCEYESKDDSIWFPRRWTNIHYGANVIPHRFEEVSVTEVQFNPDITKKDFQIQFPIGARVSDYESQKNDDKQIPSRYFVLPDGKQRIIKEGEGADAVYDELEKSVSGFRAKK